MCHTVFSQNGPHIRCILVKKDSFAIHMCRNSEDANDSRICQYIEDRIVDNTPSGSGVQGDHAAWPKPIVDMMWKLRFSLRTFY